MEHCSTELWNIATWTLENCENQKMNVPGMTPPMGGGLGGGMNDMQGMNEQEQMMVKGVRCIRMVSLKLVEG